LHGLVFARLTAEIQHQLFRRGVKNTADKLPAAPGEADRRLAFLQVA